MKWNESKWNKDELIRIIGHSHGGNVAIAAINLLAEQGIYVETLITIGTPERDDFQLQTSVGQHINVYNSYDDIQISGGKVGNMLGIADREFSNAENVEVILPMFRRNTLFGVSNHSYMHNNIKIWNKYILNLVEK